MAHEHFYFRQFRHADMVPVWRDLSPRVSAFRRDELRESPFMIRASWNSALRRNWAFRGQLFDTGWKEDTLTDAIREC